MENFSLLSISGPRVSSFVLRTFPDIMSSRATSLPDIAKTALPTEASGPAQALPPQGHGSVLRHGVHNTVFSPDGLLGDSQPREPRRSCTIYRPWFSPYSYFVCTDQESQPEALGFPEVQQDEGRGEGRLPEELAESICSSSSSPEDTCPREAARKPGPSVDSADSITSRDILVASRWRPAQQGGYKCAACCRMYPTLHSLKSHIRGGLREGFSCKVYYRKLKALWGQEKARLGDRLASSGCQRTPRRKGDEACLCLQGCQ
uniref:Spermatogenesis associated 46 n=1 Tax=Suricata suricatta TaxID=37032 RepID=A0A673U075_SURSU